MDFNAAIRAHSAWKQKLADYLRKPDQSIDVAKLGQDDQCDLGRWIQAEAKSHALDAAFVELKKEHASFHRVAADVVRRANAGQKVSEEVALCGKSPFATASAHVVMAITKLKQAKERTLVTR
ncbi:MAG TPA: CZB domain-containing protein [Bryobacteraceae bacterium]|jgi:hypothetical protein